MLPETKKKKEKKEGEVSDADETHLRGRKKGFTGHANFNREIRWTSKTRKRYVKVA